MKKLSKNGHAATFRNKTKNRKVRNFLSTPETKRK